MKALHTAHAINNFLGFVPFCEQNQHKSGLKSWYIDDWLKCYIQDFYIENFYKTKFQSEFVFAKKTKTITSKFDLIRHVFSTTQATFFIYHFEIKS